MAVYLTLDTCVWISLLPVGLGEEDNLFDEICFWIEKGHMIHIVPENIIAEWDRNTEKYIKEATQKLRGKSDLLKNDPKNRDKNNNEILKINGFIQDRIARIDNIFLKHSEKAPYDDQLRIAAFNRIVEDGKAPENIKDVINILSLVEFLKTIDTVNNTVYFSTIDYSDFSIDKARKEILHPDLEPDFQSVNLEYCFFDEEENFGVPLLNKLRGEHKLDSFQDYLKKTAESESSDKLINKDYLENTKHIDTILSKNKRTSFEEDILNQLLKSSKSYRTYFFKHVNGSSWLEFLKNQGYLNPNENPSDVKTPEGIYVPLWEPLIYLEKLSLETSESKDPSLIRELISFIQSVSKHYKNNSRTNHLILKILVNLPNESIPKEIFEFLPKWFNGEFSTMIESSVLIEKLLPKFLSEKPTKDDIEKAELILDFIFSFQKVKIKNGAAENKLQSGFFSRIYIYYLTSIFAEEKYIERIVTHCSDKKILNLARSLRKLLTDFPYGISSKIKQNEQEFNLKILIQDDNLMILIESKEDKSFIKKERILGFIHLESSELKTLIQDSIKKHGINFDLDEKWEKEIEWIINTLTIDRFSSFGTKPIDKISDIYHSEENLLNVFSLIFRELLNKLAKLKPKEAKKLLFMLCNDKEFQLPFFHRMAIYIVGQNWDEFKPIFWKWLKDGDTYKLFSTHRFSKDLYFLLKTNQTKLLDVEIAQLKAIFEEGPKDKDENDYEGYENYWRQKWYSALREINPFKELYNELSESSGLDSSHFENEGQVRVSKGDITPLPIEDILKMDNESIVHLIKTFNPADRWNSPSISGLSNELGKAVETDPEFFVSEMELYNDVPYIYFYQILHGLRDAWRKKKSFDWNKVLQVCKQYVFNAKFYSGEFRFGDDGWNADQYWVIRAICELLAEGMQSDKNAFDLSLLPQAKELLIEFASRVEVKQDLTPEVHSNKKKPDYIIHFLNSTEGKILNAILNYALRRARNLPKETTDKFEEDIKEVYVEFERKNILDAYITMGFNFEHLHYLDKDWIISQAKKYYPLEEKKWIPFFDGLTSGRPPFSKELYELMYPHYERAINEKIDVDKPFGNGLNNHLISFFFWGFENLESPGLLFKYLNSASSESLSDFVSFVSNQRKYIRSLDAAERVKSEKQIIELWNYLAKKVENPTNDHETILLARLLFFMRLFSSLNEDITNLILKSSHLSVKYYYTYELIESLNAFRKKGDPIETANFIGKILNSIPFNFEPDVGTGEIEELVKFLYQNHQKDQADQFCNIQSSKGWEFLRPIYNKYNP